MRIISGTHKGKRLVAPKSLPVRPTTDFAKEGLFNILNHRLVFSEIRVLDLFAGTGSISFEFASRGTTEITAVDADFGCTKFITKISTELGFDIAVVKSDVQKFLDRSMGHYDLIFADPPYAIDSGALEKVITAIFQNQWLAEEGLLIVEHPKQKDLASWPHFWNPESMEALFFLFFNKSRKILLVR